MEVERRKGWRQRLRRWVLNHEEEVQEEEKGDEKEADKGEGDAGEKTKVVATEAETLGVE